MKVIGAGFGRTGTASLKAALDRLGVGPCFHMSEVFEHPDRVPYFRAAARGEAVDWDAAFAGYESTVDWPGAAFWRELAARYPEAKVLLSVRDPARWHASMRDTILPAADAAPERARQLPELVAPMQMLQDVVWQGTFDGRGGDEAYATRVFTEHNAAVRREIPADRLLEYEVGQGWGPLCAFLGVDVPDEDFPHLNDGASFRQRIADRLASS
ncbi:sulfotransferase family protein [Actinocatenispora rupis]|uniref:Sulfotransferase family protein n=1 Tax=Actinocatenispora rupis TaxID=519421 RepID=A0A8J3J232_9ACTN|nr:sulfotransferase family protein [Actinocatenispora rupis]GID13125.1 sulfotransferase family protein [Actinocatenispora rupis]